MKIDYTNYLRDKPHETDPDRIGAMQNAVIHALASRGLSGAQFVKCDCFTDGCVRVEINGNYYGIFDSITGKFFSGSVGD